MERRTRWRVWWLAVIVLAAAGGRSTARAVQSGDAPPRFTPPSVVEATQATYLAEVEPARGTPRTPPGDLEGLPNTAGQIWRQYDLRPYSHQISTTQTPQKAIVDWVLRETGVELWFYEPLGVLSATREQLSVYHTPEVQAVVGRIVERFLKSGGRLQTLGLRLVTVSSPNWRSAAYNMMQPIDIETAGVEGWMVSKENAALLFNQLRRRVDFTDHGSGDVVLPDGQKLVLQRSRPVEFTPALRWAFGQMPPYELISKRIDEGYTLEISALTGEDGSIEAIIRCEVDQLEQLKTVDVDVPDLTGRGQRVPLQIPQLVSWRLHERFRWPADQVLLLSCGVVPRPSDTRGGLDLATLFNPSRGRADALLFIEYKGPPRTAAAGESPPALTPVAPPR